MHHCVRPYSFLWIWRLRCCAADPVKLEAQLKELRFAPPAATATVAMGKPMHHCVRPYGFLWIWRLRCCAADPVELEAPLKELRFALPTATATVAMGKPRHRRCIIASVLTVSCGSHASVVVLQIGSSWRRSWRSSRRSWRNSMRRDLSPAPTSCPCPRCARALSLVRLRVCLFSGIDSNRGKIGLFREKMRPYLEEVSKKQKAALLEAYSNREPPILRLNSQEYPCCTVASPPGVLPGWYTMTNATHCIACGLCQYLMALFFVRKMFI
jgi:hypothetical protein